MRTVRAELRVTSKGVVASLTLRSADGSDSSTRTVQAQNCDDAVEATALVAAVMLDPMALTGSADSGADTGTPEPPPAPTPPPPPPRPPVPPPPRDIPPKPPVAKRSAVQLSLAASAEGLILPSAGSIGGAGGSIALRWERPSTWSPMLRAALLDYPLADDMATPLGRANLTIEPAVRFDLCPARLGDSVFSVYGCAMAFYGRLESAGSIGSVPSKQTNRPFWAVGGSLIAVATVAQNVELIAAASPGLVPIRDAYAVENPETHDVHGFYNVQLLVISGGLGIGVRFP